MFWCNTIPYESRLILSADKSATIKVLETAEYADLMQIEVAIGAGFAILPGSTAHIYYVEDGLGRELQIASPDELERFKVLLASTEFQESFRNEECFLLEFEAKL